MNRIEAPAGGPDWQVLARVAAGEPELFRLLVDVPTLAESCLAALIELDEEVAE